MLRLWESPKRNAGNEVQKIMISNKKVVQHISSFCKALALTDWVFSPGSRNAPFTLSIAPDSDFNCITITDERSAAFIALGMSLHSQKATVLSCTSGTASLNYASAVAEAHYQKVPLLIITSDRPQHWIDKGEGQSIRQKEIYQNYAKSSYHINDFDAEKEIIEVLKNIELDLFSGKKGPVHLNVSFEEPLYETAPKNDTEFTPALVSPNQFDDITGLHEQWQAASQIMILCGQANAKEHQQMSLMAMELNVDSRVVVLTETTSNVSGFQYVNCIDRTLERVPKEDANYQPDLLITLGDAIISKKIKNFLRAVPNLVHWHIQEHADRVDTYNALEKVLNISPSKFTRFANLTKTVSLDSDFSNKWMSASFLAKEQHDIYLRTCSWSDLKAHEILQDTYPDNINLHFSNSSVIRYNQLFTPIQTNIYYSNRGVSGIDGCTSAAIGVSLNSDRFNVLVTGDLGFVYDSNAFWNTLKVPNLRVIVINNNGGGIFRIIPGPETTEVLDTYFEVGNSASIEHICKAFNIGYRKATNESELDAQLETFYSAQSDRPIVLEVVTPNLENDKVLKAYFNNLKN